MMVHIYLVAPLGLDGISGHDIDIGDNLGVRFPSVAQRGSLHSQIYR